MSAISIIEADLTNIIHQDAIFSLMNIYITDKMGGGTALANSRKMELINGLRNVPTSLVFLAVIDNEYVGLVNAFVNFGTFALQKFINVHDVVVHHAYRGQGIGEALMRFVEQKAVSINCAK
ncbi:MAG: GNAT family N-acetyltransferase [Bacteroidales bacterium]|nr:GNAT family N-acetyltransferase [Bacteroidales bacterium]